MKRRFIWIIVLFVIIIISIFTYFYLSGAVTYQRIDIYTAKGFNKKINTPIISINDKKTLKEVSIIIRKSKKLPGVLDVVSPEYIMEIHSYNKSIQTLYLWVGKDNVKGMYMYKNNTETGYSISEKNNQKLRKIVTITKK